MSILIGELVGNKVQLGSTGNGLVYKNSKAFDEKSDEICYISEHGVEGDTITEDSCVYRYADFIELAKDYINENNLNNTPQDLAEQLFDSVDWQDPSTILNDWEMDLEDEY